MKLNMEFPFARVSALNGIGILFCSYLLYLSFSGEADHFCELFGTDCLSVIHSSYSRFWGFSSTSLGLGYFTFQLLLLLGLKKSKSIAPEMLNFSALLISSAGLSFSLYYVYVLNVILEESCSVCYGVHLINIILFVQYLILIRKQGIRLNIDRLLDLFKDAGAMAVCITALLLSSNIVFGANLLETRIQLDKERKKLSDNLRYYQFLYSQSNKFEFAPAPGDIVLGEKGIAVHQIVLLYQDGCKHCQKAKEKLSRKVKKNENAVYLVLKNINDLNKEWLKRIKVSKVPAVFIDGKMAEGWDVPGFLTKFLEDCGC